MSKMFKYLMLLVLVAVAVSVPRFQMGKFTDLVGNIADHVGDIADHVGAVADHAGDIVDNGNYTIQSNDNTDTAEANQNQQPNATFLINNGTSDKLDLKDEPSHPVNNGRGNTTHARGPHRYRRQVHESHSNPNDCFTELRNKPAKCSESDVIILPHTKTLRVPKPMHLEQSQKGQAGYDSSTRNGFGLNPRGDSVENNASFEHRTSGKRHYNSEEDDESTDDTVRRRYRDRMNSNGDGYRRDHPRNTYNDRGMERDHRKYGNRVPANSNRNTRNCEEFYKLCNGEHKPNVNFGDNFGSNPSGFNGFYDEYSNGMDHRRRPNPHDDYPEGKCIFPGFDGSCMRSFGPRRYDEGFHGSRYDTGSSEDAELNTDGIHADHYVEEAQFGEL